MRQMVLDRECKKGKWRQEFAPSSIDSAEPRSCDEDQRKQDLPVTGIRLEVPVGGGRDGTVYREEGELEDAFINDIKYDEGEDFEYDGADLEP